MLAAIIFKEDTSRVYSADVLDPNLMSNARENRVRELNALAPMLNESLIFFFFYRDIPL